MLQSCPSIGVLFAPASGKACGTQPVTMSAAIAERAMSGRSVHSEYTSMDVVVRQSWTNPADP